MERQLSICLGAVWLSGKGVLETQAYSRRHVNITEWLVSKNHSHSDQRL